MYIDRLNSKSFGPFEELYLKFIRKGLNIVFGDNTTGRSQIVAGIIGSISPHPELFIKSNDQVATPSEFNSLTRFPKFTGNCSGDFHYHQHPRDIFYAMKKDLKPTGLHLLF